MIRYARITEKLPREFLLLQGQGCFHKGCRFCHYYDDVSDDPFAVNEPVIRQVTGAYGVLDVINSGSVHEFDGRTLRLIAEIVRLKQIHTLWFEAHYHYRDRLDEIRALFPGVRVRFRTGIESFDHDFRVQMNKGIPDVSPEQLRRDFDGVCLLVCVAGQSQESILRDIEIANAVFDYFSVNVFCPNSTDVRLDRTLYEWFRKNLYPRLTAMKNCEVLMENTDLGVG
ncbi:MAG: radical SAM protein [Clostridiales Family XIII bacterium]|jgi:hypothetical protein|nr:radical SAM protein [Clostridiales Family XIII bacterium]